MIRSRVLKRTSVANAWNLLETRAVCKRPFGDVEWTHDRISRRSSLLRRSMKQSGDAMAAQGRIFKSIRPW